MTSIINKQVWIVDEAKCILLDKRTRAIDDFQKCYRYFGMKQFTNIKSSFIQWKFFQWNTYVLNSNSNVVIFNENFFNTLIPYYTS